MAVTRAREQGYLVLGDISGYTSFLTSTELEHAHGIVAELTQVLIARLGEPLRFVELEGDAVFAYAPAAAFADAERLLDMIEGCYVAFQLRLEEMRRATTCTCSACSLIGALDLKFVAHLGSFVQQQTPTGPKPIGPDVILVHRLLKNHIADVFGTKAYAFLPKQNRAGRRAANAQCNGAHDRPQHGGDKEQAQKIQGPFPRRQCARFPSGGRVMRRPGGYCRPRWPDRPRLLVGVRRCCAVPTS